MTNSLVGIVPPQKQQIAFGVFMLSRNDSRPLGSREVQEHHGFNEIAVYWEGSCWEIVLTRYIRQGTAWVPDARMVVGQEPSCKK
jgi:hypothetical protein